MAAQRASSIEWITPTLAGETIVWKAEPQISAKTNLLVNHRPGPGNFSAVNSCKLRRVYHVDGRQGYNQIQSALLRFSPYLYCPFSKLLRDLKMAPSAIGSLFRRQTTNNFRQSINHFTPKRSWSARSKKRS
jgi:hypothetical protein